jgi:hypothetical protein
MPRTPGAWASWRAIETLGLRAGDLDWPAALGLAQAFGAAQAEAADYLADALAGARAGLAKLAEGKPET